jgi:hypothetical protein
MNGTFSRYLVLVFRMRTQIECRIVECPELSHLFMLIVRRNNSNAVSINIDDNKHCCAERTINGSSLYCAARG